MKLSAAGLPAVRGYLILAPGRRPVSRKYRGVVQEPGFSDIRDPVRHWRPWDSDEVPNERPITGVSHDRGDAELDFRVP